MNNLLRIFAYGSVIAIMTSCVATKRNDEPDGHMERQFANPPAEFRIMRNLHNWPKDDAAQEERVKFLQANGFGGAVTNVDFNNGYVESADNWQAFLSGLKRLKDAGFTTWLYDEAGYPSGRAGTLVLKDHPEFEAQGLLAAEAIATDGAVVLDVPPGEIVFALALPIRDGIAAFDGAIDLSSFITGNELFWPTKSGIWKILVIAEGPLFEGTQVDQGAIPEGERYVSILRPDATDQFLQITHERYASHLGQDLGKYFISTFTDEPSANAIFFRKRPYKPIPWSANLPGEFEKRHGYSLLPLIPHLFIDTGSQSKRVRHDYWQTLSDLIAENYFGKLQDWCRAHNLPSGGHMLLEENILHHVPLYGDMFRCFRRMDVPGIDVLSCDPAITGKVNMHLMGSEVPWYAARLASSAAELEGKADVMSETSEFHQMHAKPPRIVSEEEFRGTFNRVLLGGANRLNTYSFFRDLSTETVTNLNLWVGRCSLMLTGGHRVSDIAVLYPIESLWTRFEPSSMGVRGAPKSAKELALSFRAVGDVLYDNQMEFGFIDSKTLAESKIQDGQLVHGNLKWRVIVLPHTDTLPIAAWRNLRKFWKSGGVVVAIGDSPRNSETEFPSSEVLQISQEIFNDSDRGIVLPTGKEKQLPEALTRFVQRDLVVSEASSPLRFTHRRIHGSEVYFIINDSAQPWTGSITLGIKGSGRKWDPATGNAEAIASTNNLHLHLNAYGATIITIKKG